MQNNMSILFANYILMAAIWCGIKMWLLTLDFRIAFLLLWVRVRAQQRAMLASLPSYAPMLWDYEYDP